MTFVLVSLASFVAATMLSVLKPYSLYLAYPSTVLVWIGIVLDIVAVVIVFVDVWTAYAHLNNEHMFLLKMKKMIQQDLNTITIDELPASILPSDKEVKSKNKTLDVDSDPEQHESDEDDHHAEPLVLKMKPIEVSSNKNVTYRTLKWRKGRSN